MHSVAGTSAVGSASFSGTKQYGWNEHTEIQNSLMKCADIEKSRSFFVITIDFSTGYCHNNSEGGD